MVLPWLAAQQVGECAPPGCRTLHCSSRAAASLPGAASTSQSTLPRGRRQTWQWAGPTWWPLSRCGRTVQGQGPCVVWDAPGSCGCTARPASEDFLLTVLPTARPAVLQIIFASNSFAPGAFGVGLLFRILPAWLEPAVFNLFFRAVVRLVAPGARALQLWRMHLNEHGRQGACCCERVCRCSAGPQLVLGLSQTASSMHAERQESSPCRRPSWPLLTPSLTPPPAPAGWPGQAAGVCTLNLHVHGRPADAGKRCRACCGALAALALDRTPCGQPLSAPATSQQGRPPTCRGTRRRRPSGRRWPAASSCRWRKPTGAGGRSALWMTTPTRQALAEGHAAPPACRMLPAAQEGRASRACSCCAWSRRLSAAGRRRCRASTCRAHAQAQSR